jgi:hypothetical protein
MKHKLRINMILVTIIFLFCLSSLAFAATTQEIDNVLTDTAQYLVKTVKAPQVGSVGGEWAVIGLARSGYDVPENYFRDYYQTVVKYVEECDGVLHDKKYTEYSRLILGLTAAGYDPRDVGGYNLTTALGDFDKTIWQGINGPIFALIALDSANYPMPQNPEAAVQSTRDMYVEEILRRQLSDGGFSLFGGSASASAADETADPDVTGMALQALAKYQARRDVKEATEKAIACLSAMQDDKGGYTGWDVPSSESCVQVIVALTELGIDFDDPRFIKNGYTLVDNLLSYYQKGKGFLHSTDGSGLSQMSTEQAFYALVAAQRAQQGKNSLYRMDDVVKGSDRGTAAPPAVGLSAKNPDVKEMPITAPGITFPDIAAHKNKAAIEKLAARGIINGKSEAVFDPEATMTRAEYATIVVRGLGLAPKANNKFTDVSADAWYAGYIGTANSYGIVNGISDTAFNPQGTITRQEAGTMVARAAKLCGMDTEMGAGEVRDMLAQFGDYQETAEWAKGPLAFCYREGILSQEDQEILPLAKIKRSEIAQMLFNLLSAARLL